jgi:hypothetical protein
MGKPHPCLLSMAPPESSLLPAAAPNTPARRLSGVLFWFRFLLWLVFAFLVSVAVGLAVAPNYGAAVLIALLVYVGLALALERSRAWFLSPQARKLHAALAGLFVLLLVYMTWDDSAMRLPLTMAGLTPLPLHGAESDILYNRLTTPKNGPAPFADSKIVRRNSTDDPVGWRKFIEANRDAIRADWEEATELRARIAGLDAFDLIGDTATSWDSLPSTVSTYEAMRTASFVYCDYASLLALENRGDEAVAVITPMLSISYKLQPSARTTLRFMTAKIVQGMSQDTARFILANGNPSPSAVRALAAVVERGISPGPDLHRVLMSEYAGILPMVLLEDAHLLEAPFKRIPRPLLAIIYNPRGTANLLATYYERIATAAASRNLAELNAPVPSWRTDLGRPALKNPTGRMVVGMFIPVSTKSLAEWWKNDDARRALLADVQKRLAADAVAASRPRWNSNPVSHFGTGIMP